MRHLMALLLATALVAGCTVKPGDDGTKTGAYTIVLLETTEGELTIRFYDELTPSTAGNWLALAKNGMYDGSPFHRIISGFMMQGGDYTKGDGTGGRAHPDFDPDGDGMIADEFHASLKHDGAGVLSMANRGANTGSSQFFITFDATPWLDGKHAVFGQVTDGFDVLERVDSQVGSESGAPRRPVSFIGVEFLQCGPAAPEGPCPGRAPPPEPITEGGDVPLGLITPGRWDVGATQDQILVWAENREAAPAVLNWSVSFPEGSPEGWTISGEDAEPVPAAGQTRTGGRGETVRTNWTWTLLTITVPEGTGPGTVPITISNGHTTLDAELVVGTLGRVAQAGDTADVAFRGAFTDGEVFYEGTIPGVTVAGGGLVPGADLGLVGLQEGETQTLVLPPPLAYGYDNPPSHARFDGQTLHFQVTIESLE